MSPEQAAGERGPGRPERPYAWPACSTRCWRASRRSPGRRWMPSWCSDSPSRAPRVTRQAIRRAPGHRCGHRTRAWHAPPRTAFPRWSASCGARSRAAGAADAGLDALDRGAPLHQHERRSGERVLLRRHLRGNHQRAGPAARDSGWRRAPRRSRSRARNDDLRTIGDQLSVAHRARGQRPQGRQPDPDHRPADQCRRWLSALVGALRPGADRRLRHPGRDRQRHRRTS